MNVTVIIPTYNEAGNIRSLLQSLHATLPDAELIVVDDDSPDGTSQIIRTHPAPYIRLITRATHHGLTNSLKEGIARTTGDVVVWMDADFSHPPGVIPKLLAKIRGGFDMAVASRYTGGNWGRLSASSVLNRYIRLLYPFAFHDYTSGFIAVKRQVLHNIPLEGSYGEYFISLVIRALRKGYRVAEVGYNSPRRTSGESKTHIMYGMRYLITATHLLWKYEH